MDLFKSEKVTVEPAVFVKMGPHFEEIQRYFSKEKSDIYFATIQDLMDIWGYMTQKELPQYIREMFEDLWEAKRLCSGIDDQTTFVLTR